MELTTLLFLGFFAAVALLNYTLPRVLRPYCLLAASYLFYCWGACFWRCSPVWGFCSITNTGTCWRQIS